MSIAYATSLGRTIVPDSSIHTVVGTLTMLYPVTTCLVSINEGCAGLPALMNGPAAAAPPESNATVTIGEVEVLEFFVQRLPPGQVKGASSPGRPCEQENLLAVKSTSDAVCLRGRATQIGSFGVPSALSRSAASAPKYHTRFFASHAHGLPIWSASALKLSQVRRHASK